MINDQYNLKAIGNVIIPTYLVLQTTFFVLLTMIEKTSSQR